MIIISTLLTKPTQDLAKQLLSTIKTTPNPRGNIEMFDCIMEYVRQCNNVESILKFGNVHGNTSRKWIISSMDGFGR